MNRHYQFILAAAVALLAAGCNPEGPEGSGNGDQTETISFKILSAETVDGISSDWTDGAEVSVFDGFSGTKTQTNVLYTISAADGTKADLTTKVKKVQKQDTYVALYPYASSSSYSKADGTLRMTLPSLQNHAPDAVAPGALPLIATSSNNDLAFRQLCGVFRISLTGEVSIESIEIDAESVSGQATVDVATGALTMDAEASRNITYSCGSPVALSAEPTVFNIVLPPAEYAEIYYTVYASDGTKLECCDENVTIAAGQVKDAATTVYDAKFGGMMTDLSDEGYANCYIVSNPGKYSFDCVIPDDAKTVVKGSSARWLWATSGLWTSQAEADASKMITEVGYDAENDRIVFTVPEGMIYGNVVVALMKQYEVSIPGDEDAGTTDITENRECIEYTWHLWFTPRVSTVDVGGVAFMDRNLGAGGVFDPRSATCDNCRGLSYQWDRKDPFPGPKTGYKVETDISFEPGVTPFYCVNNETMVDRWLNNAVGRPKLPSGADDPQLAFNCQVPHFSDYSGRVIPLLFQDNSATAVVKAYSQIPFTFLAGGTNHPASSGGTIKSWNDVANPCPYGYHIPSQEEASVLMNSETVTVAIDQVVPETEGEMINTATTVFNGSLNFPHTGYRGYATSPTRALIAKAGVDGRYILKETASDNANHASWIVIGSGPEESNLCSISDYNRLHGGYVRCVRN